MRTYAVALSGGDVAELLDAEFPAILVSFAYDAAGRLLGRIPPGSDVILDSGAFTAWTTGKAVDVDAYAEWAALMRERHPEAVVTNLDVIPGTAEQPVVSELEKRRAIKASAENAERLRDAGLPVMEVYHLYEQISVLRAILGRRRDGERISFGGLARQRGGPGFRIKQSFCATAFALLRDEYGWDRLPMVHGLGVAPDGPIGAATFPWASVDCSSWGTVAQYGVGVTKRGKRLGGRSDKRVSNATLAKLYRRRVLDGWKRLDDDCSRLWASRGVRFMDHALVP